MKEKLGCMKGEIIGMRTIKFTQAISELIRKYKRSPYLEEPTAYAVLCGKYNSKIARTARADVISAGTIEEESPLLAIVISPITTFDEIKSVYYKELPKLLKWYKKKTSITDDKYSKTKRSIREHRKWYWLKQSGLGYGKIAKTVKVERQTVIDAIKNYKKLLT